MITKTIKFKKQNVKMRKGEFLPDFFKREIPKFPISDNTLFLTDELLDNLPRDWMDCIFFLINQNYNKVGRSPLVICLDDNQTAKAMEFLAKDEIKLIIESIDDGVKFWDVMLTHKEQEVLFIGGENLRKFCDKNNIFYRSFQTDQGLISGTNMKYQKNENEDCRTPTGITR